MHSLFSPLLHRVLKSLTDIEFQEQYFYIWDLKSWTGIFDDHFRFFHFIFLPFLEVLCIAFSNS